MDLKLSVTGKKIRKNRSKGLENPTMPVVTAAQALECLEEKICSRFKHVKDAFIHMDYDCDGKISCNEFRVTLDLMGLVMEDIEYLKLWSYFDASGDGAIDYTEFNNKIGCLIHPPITKHVIDRPQTPRVRHTNARKVAMAVKKKMRNLEEAFKMIDLDGSGTISHAEFIQALRHVGISKMGHEETYRLMMKYKDPKSDVTDGLTWDEFKRTMEGYLKLPEHEAAAAAADQFTYLPVMSLNHAEKLLCEKLWGKFSAVQRAFRLFDEDKSGDLSYDEFRAALRSLGVSLTDADYRELMAKYDENGDGVISYDEFNKQVGSMIHPDAINRNELFNKMLSGAGAQESALHFNPHAHLGLYAEKPDGTPREISMTARARALAPRLGLVEAETFFAQQAYGRYHDVQAALRMYDRDFDGCLNRKEFATMIEHLGLELSRKQLDDLMVRYDTSGDGKISYDEFNARVGPLLHTSDNNRVLLGMSDGEMMELHKQQRERAAAYRVALHRAEEEAKEEEEGKTADAGRPPIPKLPLGGSSARAASSIGGGAALSTGRSIATCDIDVDATETKMQKILGRSWMAVYKNMKQKQARDGGSGLKTSRFRDAMAEKGVPLTSKEVRALAKRYHRPDSSGSVDYKTLMRKTFAGGAATGAGGSRSGRHSARSSAGFSLR